MSLGRLVGKLRLPNVNLNAVFDCSESTQQLVRFILPRNRADDLNEARNLKIFGELRAVLREGMYTVHSPLL